MIETILETFENDDLRVFAKRVIDQLPDYWHHVPASSTGKYHPAYALGEGGLERHTVALCIFLNHMLAVLDWFTPRERDLLRIAGIAHDGMKSGTQEDYERSKYTKVNHPVLAAQFIMNMSGYECSEDDLCFIANAIESHMGQWNKDRSGKEIMPKPKTKYEYILHLADYLASRKDIDVSFDGYEKKKSTPKVTPENYVIAFGKYKGCSLANIYEKDKSYVEWLRKNVPDPYLESVIAQLK